MASSNSILIISDNKEFIVYFRSKLSLLRDIDSIMEAPCESALEACQQLIPEIVIISADAPEQKFIDICTQIKQDNLLKPTPVLFIVNFDDEDFLLSAFDAGMNEYMFSGSKDSEILMKVIWSMQQGEKLRELDKKEDLLIELDVLYKNKDSYTPQYTSKVFSNEVKSAHKYKSNLVLLAVSKDKQCADKLSDIKLGKVISNCIRNADILGMPSPGLFLVILAKTHIKGASRVFERIQSCLEVGVTVSAGACELKENMDYESLSKFAVQALNNAVAKGNNIVISNQAELRIEKTAEWTKKIEPKNKNFKLFKQAFNKKINNIIQPAFTQSEKSLKEKYQPNIQIEHSIAEAQCSFSLKEPFNNNEAILKITDLGLSKIELDVFYLKKGEPSNHSTKIDLNELDESKLLSVIENISKDFENFVS